MTRLFPGYCCDNATFCLHINSPLLQILFEKLGQFIGDHSTFSSIFPCYCFPKLSMVEDKMEREQILTISLCFQALCKHMHFPLVAPNYLLNFVAHTQTGHFSSIPDKR